MTKCQKPDSGLCRSLAYVEFLDEFCDKVELFGEVWSPDTVGGVEDKYNIGRGVTVGY